MRTAVAYTRVSTERQLRLSPELQREKIAAFVADLGWTLHPQSFGEAGSGRSQRADLDRAVDLTCALGKAGALITYDTSRLFRNARHGLNLFARLEESKAVFLSVNDGQDTQRQTATDRLNRTIMLAIGQHSAEQTGEKIRDQNRKTVAALGYRTNGEQPYGYRLDKTFDATGRITSCVRVEVPEEMVVATRALALYQENGRSLQEQCDILNAERITPPRGERWEPRQYSAFVRKLLKRT